MVGIPRGRSPPPGFGIITLRTGAGRYVCPISSFLTAASHLSRPRDSMLSKLSLSIPGAPPLAFAIS
jgi:hypothetical protein